MCIYVCVYIYIRLGCPHSNSESLKGRWTFFQTRCIVGEKIRRIRQLRWCWCWLKDPQYPKITDSKTLGFFFHPDGSLGLNDPHWNLRFHNLPPEAFQVFTACFFVAKHFSLAGERDRFGMDGSAKSTGMDPGVSWPGCVESSWFR